MGGENLQQRSDQQGESSVIERSDEKIEVEIREVVRIRPQDFSALKNSFEEWRDKWE